MTIERELLKRIANYGDALPSHFIYEINELLAQPEQTEQEPVAWMYEWVNEIGEPVKSIVYNFYEDSNLIPLYTAPPTREPLSEEEMSKAFMQDDYGKWDIKSFVNGIRFAEKAHGIGGGE